MTHKEALAEAARRFPVDSTAAPFSQDGNMVRQRDFMIGYERHFKKDKFAVTRSIFGQGRRRR
jgi:hypothetical protein